LISSWFFFHFVIWRVIVISQNAVCKLEPVSAIAEASEASEGKMPFAQKAAFYGAAAGYGIGKLIQLLH
jgi:hypothetical protein